jgi:hypothetical protein
VDTGVDITSLSSFLVYMAGVTGRYADYWTAMQRCCVLSNNYKPLQSCVVGASWRYGVNSAISVQRCNFMGFLVTSIPGAFPLSESAVPNDIIIPAIDPLWYSSIITGVTTTDTVGSSGDLGHTFFTSDLLRSSSYVARCFGLTTNTFYYYVGWTKGGWDSMYGNCSFPRLKNTYDGIVCKPDKNRANTIAPSAPTLISLMKSLIGYQPRRDTMGRTIFHYVNVPQRGLVAVTYHDNMLLNTVPQFLVNPWLYAIALKVPFAMQAFPPKRVTGLTNSTVIISSLGGGDLSAPFTQLRNQYTIGENELPVSNDYDRFNARLVFHAFSSRLVDVRNGAIVSCPDPESVVCQQYITPDFTLTNYCFSSLEVANTTWIPIISTTGANIIISVSVAADNLLMTRVMAKLASINVRTIMWPDSSPDPLVLLGGKTDNDPNMINEVETTESALNSSASSSSGKEEAKSKPT